VRDFADRAVRARHIAGGIVARFFRRAGEAALFPRLLGGGREAHAARRLPRTSTASWRARRRMTGPGCCPRSRRTKAIHGQGVVRAGGQVALVQQAAIAACDAGDGVKDGLVGRPLDCGFDPATLACGDGADSAECLTAPQLASMQKLYAGVRVHEGDALVSPGYSPGGEAELSPIGGGVRRYQFGEAPGQSLACWLRPVLRRIRA
jgi:feruloyl esterase